ncbi:hypothetical protein [Dongshaea marina]|uniref:hypothetical protein n=1 Tax=Dongshaea marina TaxID=2047966 RepID=UPI000D3E6219|nr:hypothetical protein [Dongshaea marina]
MEGLDIQIEGLVSEFVTAKKRRAYWEMHHYKGHQRWDHEVTELRGRLLELIARRHRLMELSDPRPQPSIRKLLAQS